MSDAQVRKLMEEMAKNGAVGLAAMKAGMDRKTARKYRHAGKLPSEMKVPRDRRKRRRPPPGTPARIAPRPQPRRTRPRGAFAAELFHGLRPFLLGLVQEHETAIEIAAAACGIVRSAGLALLAGLVEPVASVHARMQASTLTSKTERRQSLGELACASEELRSYFTRPGVAPSARLCILIAPRVADRTRTSGR